MAMQIRPEPSAARSPRPSEASEKMVGNMIELTRPMASSDQPETAPLVLADTSSSRAARPPATASTLPGEQMRST